MKKYLLLSRLSLVWILAIVVFSSCGTQNALTKARKSGVKLEYSFPDTYMNYKLVQNIEQEIDASGQLIEIDIVSEADFLTKKNADEGDNIKIDLKLNSVSMEIDVMGQQMGPDLSELNGKEFHMVVSKTGEEVDTHEADEIIFQTSPDEKSNLGLIFNSFLPDLPDDVVKLEDSWTSRDSIYSKDGDRFTMVVTNNTHTLKNFIDLEGKNCVEVNSKYVGYIKGKSYSQGNELIIDGKISGEGTWYFDFENGRLIKDSTTGLADGSISMSMGDMSLKRIFNNTTELIK